MCGGIPTLSVKLCKKSSEWAAYSPTELSTAAGLLSWYGDQPKGQVTKEDQEGARDILSSPQRPETYPHIQGVTGGLAKGLKRREARVQQWTR